MGMNTDLPRRRLLLGTGMAGLGLAAAPLLAGCGPERTPGGRSSGNGSTDSGAVRLPTYVPYTGVTPDAPATDTGASPYFAKFPAQPASVATDKPLAGGTVDVLTIMNSTPIEMTKNPWWQALNTALGGTITLGGAPIGDYVQKFQALVAGNDLPDVAAILPGSIPQLGGLLKAKFADLSPYLSGDAAKDYPALANIPSVAWRGCVYNGAIQTVPIQRLSLYRCYLTRTDLAEKAGVDPQPKNGEELMAMLTALADPAEKRFATASIWGLLDLFLEMHGAPNGWSVKDGTFTKDYESEAFTAALESAQKAWKAGIIHPNAFDSNISLQIQEMYNNGTIAFFPTPATFVSNAAGPLATDPKATSVALQVNAWDGNGPAGRWLNNGAPYQAAVAQADPDRIKEVLRVINFLASPFGTKEYLLVQNGIEGTDYTVDAKGGFTQTDQGKANKPGGLAYAGAPAIVHFAAAYPDIAKAQYDAEVLAMKTAVPIPTVGLESKTDESKGAALTREMKDLQSDIIQGRKDLSAWAEGVKSWQSKGGDTIRGEYEEALAAQG